MDHAATAREHTAPGRTVKQNGHKAARRIACPCCDYEFTLDELDRPRSWPQLKRYMAICRRAFDNWRHGERTFADPHELRKWLEMQAGFKTLALEMPVSGINGSHLTFYLQAGIGAALAASTKKGRSRPVAFPIVHGGKLYVFVSQSVAYEEMTHKQFTDLVGKVESKIYEHTGIDPSDNGLSQIVGAHR